MTTISSTIVERQDIGATARGQTPSFRGMLGAELFKLARQRTNWVLLLLLTGPVSIYYVFVLGAPGIKEALQADQLGSMFALMSRELTLIRAFIGIFLLIVTSRMIGLEYHLGTIRVVLARGVGRVQLLGAKLLAMAIAALVVFAGCLLLATALTCAVLFLLTGSLSALGVLTAEFWRDTGLYIVTILISMADTILVATAITVTLRSLSVGLGLSLSYFAADNFLVPIMTLVYAITQNDFWLKITGYFLGPELNLMPQVVVPLYQGRPLTSIGVQPAVHYDGTHALMVALIYGVIFLGVSILLTWRRDVLE
jgi:ABC-type transport system involved in multi-copper enzyme maturation permease subunit